MFAVQARRRGMGVVMSLEELEEGFQVEEGDMVKGWLWAYEKKEEEREKEKEEEGGS